MVVKCSYKITKLRIIIEYMQLSYLGFDCIKLTTGGTTILVHPLTKECGLPASKSGAEIVITPMNSDYDAGRGSSFIINSPGEYEVKGVFVYGHFLKKQKQTVYLIIADGVRLLFLGQLKNKDINVKDLEFFKLADVVVLPVGGNGVLTAQQAVDLISDIEPRIVVPIVYQMKGLKTEYAPVETFIKAFGGKNETVEKLKITKNDLPADDVLTYIVSPAV